MALPKSGHANAHVLTHLCEAIEAVLTGKVCLTYGVRDILRWRWSSHGLDRELFDPFVAMDSETDGFPLGTVRDHWSESALSKADAERLALETERQPWMVWHAQALLSATVAALADVTNTDTTFE